jgi:hypothetical protein
MDRLVNVSKRALEATRANQDAEMRQFKLRMQQLKTLQANQPQQRGTSMLDVAGGIGIASGVSAVASTITNMVKGTINLAANAEQMRISFEVLLGSADAGQKMFDKIERFAARTSFDLESAAQAAKSMMAAGVQGKDLLSATSQWVLRRSWASFQKPIPM